MTGPARLSAYPNHRLIGDSQALDHIIRQRLDDIAYIESLERRIAQLEKDKLGVSSIILVAPNNSKWRVTISNAGSLSTTAI